MPKPLKEKRQTACHSRGQLCWAENADILVDKSRLNDGFSGALQKHKCYMLRRVTGRTTSHFSGSTCRVSVVRDATKGKDKIAQASSKNGNAVEKSEREGEMGPLLYL